MDETRRVSQDRRGGRMKAEKEIRAMRRENRRPLSQQGMFQERRVERDAAFTERDRELAERTRRSARI
nr:hypothetical protein [uncultured Roseateles sp.]